MHFNCKSISKSDKICCTYLVINCGSLRTFWTPLVAHYCPSYQSKVYRLQARRGSIRNQSNPSLFGTVRVSVAKLLTHLTDTLTADLAKHETNNAEDSENHSCGITGWPRNGILYYPTTCAGGDGTVGTVAWGTCRRRAATAGHTYSWDVISPQHYAIVASLVSSGVSWNGTTWCLTLFSARGIVFLALHRLSVFCRQSICLIFLIVYICAV